MPKIFFKNGQLLFGMRKRMSNQDLVYKLATKYIAGDNGDFNHYRDHLFGETHKGITFYKVGQDGSVEYYLGVSSRGTLYKRVVKRSFRVHMDLFDYHRLVKSDDDKEQVQAFDSEEELISEEIIPLLYPSQIGFIGGKNEIKDYH